MMLLIICEYRENRRREDRTCIMGVNKITFFACTVTEYGNLKVKNALVTPLN